MAEESFLHSKLQWNLIDKGEHKIMLDYYKALIDLRKTNPVLKNLNRNGIEAIPDQEQKTLLLQRWNEHGQVIGLMNFSNKEQIIKVPEQAWIKIFDSADRKWNGPKASPNQLNNTTITIQPQSILLYQAYY
jgi:maltooligosyltrehalose trehalohydrolase